MATKLGRTINLKMPFHTVVTMMTSFVYFRFQAIQFYNFDLKNLEIRKYKLIQLV